MISRLGPCSFPGMTGSSVCVSSGALPTANVTFQSSVNSPGSPSRNSTTDGLSSCASAGEARQYRHHREQQAKQNCSPVDIDAIGAAQCFVSALLSLLDLVAAPIIGEHAAQRFEIWVPEPRDLSGEQDANQSLIATALANLRLVRARRDRWRIAFRTGLRHRASRCHQRLAGRLVGPPLTEPPVNAALAAASLANSACSKADLCSV